MFGELLALGFVIVVAKKLIDSFGWHFVSEGFQSRQCGVFCEHLLTMVRVRASQ